MSRNRIAALCLATALSGMTAPRPAPAQEWIVGAGFSDFTFDVSRDSGLIAAEYHHAPFYSDGRIDLAFGVAAVVQGTGDAFLGAGLAGTYGIEAAWFVEASIMPGLYIENLSINDLGSRFEIRSLLGLGYRLPRAGAVSLAVAHMSNAGTAPFNPGVNSVLLRWHAPF